MLPAHRAALLGFIALGGCGSDARTAATFPRASDPSPSPVAPPPAAAVAAPVAVDRGRLEISHKGASVGSEAFEIVRRGDTVAIATEIEMQLFGEHVTGDAELITDLGFRPLRGRASHQVDLIKVESVLSGGPDHLNLAVTATRVLGPAAPQDFNEQAPQPVDLYLDNSNFAGFAAVCAQDSHRRELRSFPSTAVTVHEVRTAADLTTWDISLGDARIEVHCDGPRLLGLDLPAVGVTVTREGIGDRLLAVRQRPRPKPALPPELIELDRAVEVRGKKLEPAILACSLVVPRTHAELKARSRGGATAALPAVVLISGATPQDRDGDTYGPAGFKLALFKAIAIELGRKGVATLRCDDRGSGASTGRFDAATLATFVADAAASVAAVRAEPAIDPKRVALLGHAEGGLIAPIVARRDPAIRALILLATTGRTFLDIRIAELRRNLAGAGKTPAEIEEAVALTRDLLTELDRGLPPDAIALLSSDGTPPALAWAKSIIGHDPAQVAARLGKIAVFIARGGADRFVGADDTRALEVGFAKAKNRRFTTTVYPELNHLFARSTRGDASDYFDAAAAIDAQFLADVVAFAGKSL